MVFRSLVALAMVLSVALASWPGPAVASHETPGTTLRLSLAPDDPFFIDGDLVNVIVAANAATTVSGDIGLGLVVPASLSGGACLSPGDLLLLFFAVGQGGGTQCLSSWVANPASRIAQLKGVTVPAGTHVSGPFFQISITPGIPRGTFVFFGYILDSANPAVVLDATTTTLDLE